MGWKTSGPLTTTTWQLVRDNRSLTSIVVRGAILAGAVALVGAGAGGAVMTVDTGPMKVLGGAIVLAGFFLSAIVWMFHVGALTYAADQALKGEPCPTPAEAMHATRSHRGQLAGYAAISTCVSLVLAALRGNGNGGNALLDIGRMLGAGLLAVLWSLITFLVVPIIMFEDLGPVAAIKRSAHLLKERWGTQIGGNIRIGGSLALLTILPAFLLGVLGVVVAQTGSVVGESGGVALIVVAVALFLVGYVLLSTMRAVFGVALYRYADTGAAVGPYADADLGGAIKPRRGIRKLAGAL